MCLGMASVYQELLQKKKNNIRRLEKATANKKKKKKNWNKNSTHKITQQDISKCVSGRRRIYYYMPCLVNSSLCKENKIYCVAMTGRRENKRLPQRKYRAYRLT